MAPTQAVAQNNEDKIFNLLFDQDELTWQTIILELIKSEQMDPWDVDVSVISTRFIGLLSEMKKMDFRISGKVILAAAFFLKIQSDKLLKEDIAVLDALIQPIDNPDELLDMLDGMPGQINVRSQDKPVLKFKTPQPRKRKVSVYDLINSLEKALEFEQKRTFTRMTIRGKKIRLPDKSKDMTVMIGELFDKIKDTLEKVQVVWYHDLIPSESKEDKIHTFVPLLHLDTQRKIDISQKEHFGDIKISLAKLAKDYA